jgi:thiol:disulfide interchange protein DsbD
MIILSLVCSASIAQTASNGVVAVSTPTVTARAGERGEFILGVEVKEGYHIQANKVKDELVPTTVEINPTPEFTLKEPIFPSPQKFKLDGADDYLNIYDGKFNIMIPFFTNPKIKRATYKLSGKLKYQACDSVRCLFPKAIDFSFRVDVQ